jgi:hypothetical protein
MKLAVKLSTVGRQPYLSLPVFHVYFVESISWAKLLSPVYCGAIDSGVHAPCPGSPRVALRGPQATGHEVGMLTAPISGHN